MQLTYSNKLGKIFTYITQISGRSQRGHEKHKTLCFEIYFISKCSQSKLARGFPLPVPY